MYSLVAKCTSSLFLPPKSHAQPSSSSIRSFEEAIDAGLRSLLPALRRGGLVSLAWLTDAFRLLTVILTGAGPLISDPSLAASDALHAYLDASVALLDACNSVYGTIALLERRLLRLRLVPRLLSDREDDGEDPAASRQLSEERLRRAHEAIEHWERNSGRRSEGEMIRRMAPEEPTPGNVSTVHRATYAAEAASHLVMAVATAVLGSGGSDLLSEVAVSRRWKWAEAYNEVAAAAVSGRVGTASPVELEEVEASVSRLKAVMCGEEEEGDGTVRMRTAVEAVEAAEEELTEKMDRLRESVNAAYWAAMATRNAALNRVQSPARRCR